MEREKSFRARWSEGLRTYGWTTISNVFLDNYAKMGLTATEAMFLVHIFEYKWSVDNPYPSLVTIAAKMGKSRKTTQRIIRGLERRGFISRHPHPGQPNRLDLNKLIGLLERIAPYPNLDREGVQNWAKVCLDLGSKEDPLRKKDKNDLKIPVFDNNSNTVRFVGRERGTTEPTLN